MSDTSLENIREKLQSGFHKIEKRIGFSHCISDNNLGTINTKFGEFLVGSPLSSGVEIAARHRIFQEFETRQRKMNRKLKNVINNF